MAKTKTTRASGLNADNLKETLWKTLTEVRTGEISAEKATAVAAQSREIMRVVAMQVKLATLQNKRPSTALIGN